MTEINALKTTIKHLEDLTPHTGDLYRHRDGWIYIATVWHNTFELTEVQTGTRYGLELPLSEARKTYFVDCFQKITGKVEVTGIKTLKDVKAEWAELDKPKVGERHKDVDGEEYVLSRYKGKLIWVNVETSECFDYEVIKRV
jgi:hypothetical protein